MAAIDGMAALLAPWALLTLLSTVPLQARATPQESAAAGRTHIVFHESPAIDLYFHVRAVAAGGTKPSEAFVPAVEAARELHRALGGNALAWGPLEGLLPDAET